MCGDSDVEKKKKKEGFRRCEAAYLTIEGVSRLIRLHRPPENQSALNKLSINRWKKG